MWIISSALSSRSLIIVPTCSTIIIIISLIWISLGSWRRFAFIVLILIWLLFLLCVGTALGLSTRVSISIRILSLGVRSSWSGSIWLFNCRLSFLWLLVICLLRLILDYINLLTILFDIYFLFLINNNILLIIILNFILIFHFSALYFL